MAEDQIMKIGDLQQVVEDQTQELEALRKRSNREVQIAPSSPATPSNKHELSTAREEIKGLKYVLPLITCRVLLNDRQGILFASYKKRLWALPSARRLLNQRISY